MPSRNRSVGPRGRAASVVAGIVRIVGDHRHRHGRHRGGARDGRIGSGAGRGRARRVDGNRAGRGQAGGGARRHDRYRGSQRVSPAKRAAPARRVRPAAAGRGSRWARLARRARPAAAARAAPRRAPAGRAGAGQCPATATATPGEKSESVTVGGMTRTFLRHIPTGYTGKTPVPVVIDYHPLGGTGSSWKASTNWSSVADSQGFIMIWLDGVGNAWNVGRCCGTAQSQNVDDVAFTRRSSRRCRRKPASIRNGSMRPAARTAAGWRSRSRATPPT